MKARVSLIALLAGLAAAPGAARAAPACGDFSSGQHFFVGPGQTCAAPAGTYNPTPTTGILPFADLGFGLAAYGNVTGHGTMTAAGAVTVNTYSGTGSAAVLARDAGVITLDKGAAINVGPNGFGVVADTNGSVTIGANGVVTTVQSTSATGLNGALYLAQTGGSITANNVTASFAANGAAAALADQSGTIIVNGGSIATIGNLAVNAQAQANSFLNLTGTHLTASGNGGTALWASSGGIVFADGLTISATGDSNVTPSQTVASGGATNNGVGGGTRAALLQLSNSTITTTKAGSYGVFTTDGGLTTLNYNTISVGGASGGFGVLTDGTGSRTTSTTITGGSITTSGAGAPALRATGSKASVTAGPDAISALTISTTGDVAIAVQADNGGVITIGGAGKTTVSATGASAGAIYATGLNSHITANSVDASAVGGPFVAGVWADQSARIDYNAGSIATSGRSVSTVSASNSGVVTLSGTQLSSTGDGGEALLAISGGRIDANGVVITSTGNIDTVNGGLVGGASNLVLLSTPSSGSILNIADSTITVTGPSVFGVFTGEGSATTLTRDVIHVNGTSLGFGVKTEAIHVAASTTISGGSISTTADFAPALWASGSAATIAATPEAGTPLTISTSGVSANAVQADGGGVVNIGAAGLTTTIHATGLFGQVYNATGANSSITATNVTATVGGGNRGGFGLFADQNGAIALNQGSVTSNASYTTVATAHNGGQITLNGTAITATGAGGAGLWASAGGTVHAIGATLLVTGGIDATSGISSGGASNNGYSTTTTGGTLIIESSNIRVTGASGYGVYTADSGVTTLTGDAIRIEGANGIGVNAGAGGQVTIHGGTIDTTAAGAIGLYASSAVGPSGASGGAAGKITVDAYNDVGLAITTQGANAHGAVAAAGGSVSLTDGSVTTHGAGGVGLYATGAQSTITALNLDVTTTGDGASAAAADTGGAIVMTGGSLTTNGVRSDALTVLNGSTATLTGTSISATGAGGGGILLDGATASFTGDSVHILVQGGYLAGAGGGGHGAGSGGSTPIGLAIGRYANSGGGGAHNNAGGAAILTNSSIRMTGDNALGVYNDFGGKLTMTGGRIETTGLSSNALFAQGGSHTQLTNVAIATSANGAQGLVVAGAGTTLTGDQLTIATSGAVDAAGTQANGVVNDAASVTLTNSSIVTGGAFAHGSVTVGGGTTVISDSSIQTSGTLGDAVYAAGGSTVTLTNAQLSAGGNAAKGVDVEGTGTKLTGSGLTISTTGTIDSSTGFHAQGVFNGSGSPPGAGTTGGGTVILTATSVTTSGSEAYGVDTGAGGSTTFNGGSITTSGVGATGLRAFGAGTTVTVGADGDAFTVIQTSGASATGAGVHSGAAMTLTGTTIATTGGGAVGLAVSDPGSSLTATDVKVTTSGGVDANGVHAFGAYNGPRTNGTAGGTLTLTNVSVATGGARAVGVLTAAGGVTGVVGGSIGTTGDFAAGVVASGAATTTISGGATISTAGAAAAGVAAFGGGAVALKDASVTTTGAGAFGLFVTDAGSKLTAENVTVNSSGLLDPVTDYNASAIFNGVYAPMNSTSGGTMVLTNVTATSGGAGGAVLNTGAGGTTTVSGGVFTMTGSNGAAAGVKGAGSLQIDGAGLVTSGDGDGGLVLQGGGQISANNLTISTTGAASAGVIAMPLTGEAGEGTITLAVSKVNTTGAASLGVGVTAGTLHVYGGSIATSGASSIAVAAGGGVLTILSGSVDTTGDGGVGLAAYGVAASATLTHVTIATHGAVDLNAAAALGALGGAAGGFSFNNLLVAGGLPAYGVAVGAGAAVALDGVDISTDGAGAHGLYVTGAGSTALLSGPRSSVRVTVRGAGAAGVLVEAGGAVTALVPLTVGAATYGISVRGGKAATSITLDGGLTLATTAADGAAIVLDGDNASFTGTREGTIRAAGTAIALLNGASQSASFTNYDIASAGDLIFSDPSNSTVNFTNTTANAGTGNLANVTNGSTLTVNATGSTLTGAFTTTTGSTSTFNLQNGSTWTITGPSTVTNFNVNNASATFAPGGGYKTLTTTNYNGTGALLTLNAALGGTNPGADQLVINGGTAKGTTTIVIHPTGTSFGAVNLPLVTTTNGGTIAPGAFTAAPFMLGGYLYSLQANGGSEYLVGVPGLTPTQANGSLASLAQSRQTQAITGRVLGSILTGATEQINCSACSSGFASFGSFALGAHGRWTLSPSLALLAGASYDSYSGRGVDVNNSVIGAMALRYDPAQMGRYRPFVEAGLAAQPYANVTFRRSYQMGLNSGAISVGEGNTLSRSVAAYGRVGYIWRLSRVDEAAAYTDLTRSWQWTAGYTESATPANPLGAKVASSLDTMNVWRIGAQYTHLFGEHIEANVSLGYSRAFGANYGSAADIALYGAASGAAPSSFDWGEWGGRLSYRFSRTVVGDAFMLGTVGAQPTGNQVHGGLALRMEF